MSKDNDSVRPSIKPRKDGPYRVDRLKILIDAEGNRISTDNRGKGNIALCRCGHSGAKPFCDGAHKRTAFSSARLADGELSRSIGGEEQRVRDREPAIEIIAAGPYLVTGGIELLETEWREGASREHYALCRCGHSKNKPFCDGTHGRVDFDDPGLDTTDGSGRNDGGATGLRSSR